jgi:hypothetical protein
MPRPERKHHAQSQDLEMTIGTKLGRRGFIYCIV